MERLEQLNWAQVTADVQRFLMKQEDLIAFKKETIVRMLER